MSNPRPYHHGDLRNQLVRAGLELIEERGADGLSLRAIATHAGVSHAAPAHHFGHLKGLLSALATEGFVRFRDAMINERLGAEQAARAQVQAAGRGYVRFARSHPALFRLMFSPSRLDSSDQHLREIANGAFEQLTDIVERLAADMKIDNPHDAKHLQVIIWSFAHGFAQLGLDENLSLSGGVDFGSLPDLTRFIRCPSD